MKKFSFTKGKLVAFILCSMIPLLAIAFGVLCLQKGMIFNVGFIVTFIVLPLVFTGFFSLCLFSNIRKSYKVILSINIAASFIILAYFSLIIGEFATAKHYDAAEAEQKYTIVQDENKLLPELSQVGQYIDIEYHRVFQTALFFSWETDYLICKYTPEEYEIQKAELEEKYVFQTEPPEPSYHDITCEPTAEVGEYQFRFLNFEEYSHEIYFPQDLILIGNSDKTQEILYIAFKDFDLDYISDLEDFILNELGWKYIR